MADLVRTTRIDDVVTLELNRPDKRNALSIELIADLNDAIGAIEHDETVRVVILGGLGKSFCSGMDLRGVLDDAQAMSGMLLGLSEAARRLRRLPVPVIARVQGAAIGGGCGLSVVADIALTHPEARLGYPEVSLGVCPAVVAPWLIKKIGAGRARSLLLTGGTMSGQQALQLGMVDQLHPQEELDEAALTLARELAAGGQQAIAVTKQWLNELDGSMDDDPSVTGAQLSAQVIAGSEAQERLRSILGY
ncbi:MAG: enoyl-CoA hydratase/isomerase family protein [Phycisphaerales bacterium]|nr:enoyl-CoA hydratase/isomerase family protein [Phycisphaerales bacterium]